MNRHPFARSWCVLSLLTLVASSSLAADKKITSVAVSGVSFNPSLGQTISASVAVASPGSVSAVVIDRDGYVVRHLGPVAAKDAGKVALMWDGRNGDGTVVPDEAYSFKIDFRGTGGEESYFPAAKQTEFLTVRPDSYDRRAGILRYTLPSACRVHIQAGSSRVDPKSGATDGPVLKTVVNRAPRPAGSVVETWLGYDESGSIYVPALPNFVMSIAATTLPENSVIAVGNRRETFIESIGRRRGHSILPHTTASTHHGGLGAAEDVAPALVPTPRDATWSSAEKAWVVRGDTLRFSVRLSAANAEAFARQPGKVMIFLDQRKVLDLPTGGDLSDIALPLSARPSESIVAVNWVTDHGPVAVTAFRVQRKSKS